MIDLDALKAAGLNSRENSERLLAEHNARLRFKFDMTRKFYEQHADAILGAKRNEWGIDPYLWDEAGIQLSPIEAALWCDIRETEAVLYPQYPVGRFFVDFGNPVARIAIECDGKVWHQDKAKDAARQAEIEDMGWDVYRFTGAECNSVGALVKLRRIAHMHGIV